MFWTSWDSNYSKIEFKLLAFFSQNSSSVKGPGSLPYLRAYSGSNLRMFLIYLVQVMIELSKMWALSLSGVDSEATNFAEGIGSIV